MLANCEPQRRFLSTLNHTEKDFLILALVDELLEQELIYWDDEDEFWCWKESGEPILNV